MRGHFAVFGHPIAQSRSPRIHAAFAAQTGIALDYVAIDAPPESFPAHLARFAAAGGHGANVTVPLKQDAFALCAERSGFAQRVGAVNTLSRREDGSWRGDNTDGPGLIGDLTVRHGFDLRQRRCLLLGAGGAARAAAFALCAAGVGELVIVNRSPERAEELAGAVGDPRVRSRRWADLSAGGRFDLVVDSTAAGLMRQRLDLPPGLLAPRALCYALSYGAAAGDFLAWARAAGAGCSLDGLGMLVEQAAESFAIWHGVRPQTDPVYALLRAELPLAGAD